MKYLLYLVAVVALVFDLAAATYLYQLRTDATARPVAETAASTAGKPTFYRFR